MFWKKKNEDEKKFVRITFADKEYTCIRDSKRAKLLYEAALAWYLGYHEICEHLENKAKLLEEVVNAEEA